MTADKEAGTYGINYAKVLIDAYPWVQSAAAVVVRIDADAMDAARRGEPYAVVCEAYMSSAHAPGPHWHSMAHSLEKSAARLRARAIAAGYPAEGTPDPLDITDHAGGGAAS